MQGESVLVPKGILVAWQVSIDSRECDMLLMTGVSIRVEARLCMMVLVHRSQGNRSCRCLNGSWESRYQVHDQAEVEKRCRLVHTTEIVIPVGATACCLSETPLLSQEVSVRMSSGGKRKRNEEEKSALRDG